MLLNHWQCIVLTLSDLEGRIEQFRNVSRNKQLRIPTAQARSATLAVKNDALCEGVCEMCGCLERAMLDVFLQLSRIHVTVYTWHTHTHSHKSELVHNVHIAETFGSLTSFGLVTISSPQHLHSTGLEASQTRADGRVSSCFGESVVDGPSWHVLLPWPHSISASVGWAQVAIQVSQEVGWVVRFMPMKIISQTATWWRNPKLWRRPFCGAAWPYANLYLNAWRWSFQKLKEVNRKKGDWWTLIWLAKVSRYHCRMEPMELVLPRVLWNWWKSTRLCGVSRHWQKSNRWSNRLDLDCVLWSLDRITMD